MGWLRQQTSVRVVMRHVQDCGLPVRHHAPPERRRGIQRNAVVDSEPQAMNINDHADDIYQALQSSASLGSCFWINPSGNDILTSMQVLLPAQACDTIVLSVTVIFAGLSIACHLQLHAITAVVRTCVISRV